MKNNDDDRNSIFSIFPGLDKLINVVADMVENDKDEVNIKGDIKPENKKKISGVYGVNIKLGPDKLDGFKDFKFDYKADKKENLPKTIIPVTDVFEEDDKITIVAELPGVEKDDIQLSIDKNTISFTAAKKDGCYSKQVNLNFIPNYSSISEVFNNSIYSIIIKK